MSEHFIRNIEIRNFKCFENFSAEGFGHVNLVGGKNNVGKTAFMEACYTNIFSHESLDTPSMALSDIIMLRYNQVILQDLLLEKGKTYIAKEIERKILEFNHSKITSNIQDITCNCQKEDLGLRDKKHLRKYFLGSTKVTNDKLEEAYGSILEQEMEDRIDALLKKVDSNIKSFRIINSEPKCNFLNNSTFISIHELGDGFYKYLSILFSIVICRNSYLFIDEIENGIHYTNLDKLWEIILTLSREQNVQVFATTHSKECIESYARVAKKLNDKDITYTVLTKLKDGSIDAGVYDSNMFINTIEQEHEVRGW